MILFCTAFAVFAREPDPVRIRFELAGQAAEAGDPLAAARMYDAVHDELPGSEVGQKALYNAGNLYVRVGMEAEATARFERYIAEYPTAPATASLLIRAAHARETAAPDDSIRLYTQLARDFPDDDFAPDAIYNAAVLRGKQGDADGAARGFEDYVVRYPARPDAAEVAALAGAWWTRVSPREARRFATRQEKRQRGGR